MLAWVTLHLLGVSVILAIVALCFAVASNMTWGSVELRVQ